MADDENAQKGLAGFLRFSAEIKELLQRERPADMRALLEAGGKATGYAGVYTRYFPFSFWMYRFDDLQKRPLSVNINSYWYQKKLHEQQVLSLLSDIAGRRTGEALFDEIDRIGKKLFILPFWLFGADHGFKNQNDFFPSMGINSTTRHIGDKDSDGHTDIGISYTASMWGPATFDPKTNLATGTSGYAGPSTMPDEVLFHEMVHATRAMFGTMDKTKVEPGYANKEEYIAVVVTNIYLAEKAPDKRHPSLRANEVSFDELQNAAKFVDNVQGINISPRQLMKEMFNGRQRPFFVALGKLPAAKVWWNPARTVGRELGIIP
jgi:Effector protein